MNTEIRFNPLAVSVMLSDTCGNFALVVDDGKTKLLSTKLAFTEAYIRDNPDTLIGVYSSEARSSQIEQDYNAWASEKNYVRIT